MAHLNEGMLRRLHDEPLAIGAAARAHYDGCAFCQQRFTAVASDAATASRLLAVDGGSVDAAGALARFRIVADTVEQAPRLRVVDGLATRWNLFAKVAASAAGVAVIATALTVSGVAQTLLTIFEPKEFVAVPISPGDLSGVPDLSAYGTFSGAPTMGATRQVADGAAASAATGLAVLTPALPAGVGGDPRWQVADKAVATFTFDAAKARAAAPNAPAMPANIDGSTLTVTTGPAVIQTYGATTSTAAGPSGAVPGLIVVQSKAPVVTSNGPTVGELQAYLLSQPGISPTLRAQILAIGDPSSTMPVPIPSGGAASKQVKVRGVNGLFVGDSTGLGSGVIWQQDGVLYAVGGMLTEGQVLAVANSLR